MSYQQISFTTIAHFQQYINQLDLLDHDISFAGPVIKIGATLCYGHLKDMLKIVTSFVQQLK